MATSTCCKLHRFLTQLQRLPTDSALLVFTSDDGTRQIVEGQVASSVSVCSRRIHGHGLGFGAPPGPRNTGQRRSTVHSVTDAHVFPHKRSQPLPDLIPGSTK
jgi:hypothetical protein